MPALFKKALYIYKNSQMFFFMIYRVRTRKI